MFSIDEPTAEAIRRAMHEGGEVAAVAELRRHFLLLADGETARACVRTIAAWSPVPMPADVKARIARKRVPSRRP